MSVQGLFGSGLASPIDDRHWQGGLPDSFEWPQLKSNGFDALVLCAKELQDDDDSLFPGVEVIRVPLRDADLTESETRAAVAAANRVACILFGGGRVLVTCAQGRNRSGLVSALILVARRGISGMEAAAWVKTRRRDALTNRNFVKFLETLPAAAPPPLPSSSPSPPPLPSVVARVLPVIVDDPDVPQGVRIFLSEARLGRLYYCRVAGTIDDGYGGFVLAALIGVDSSGVLFQALPDLLLNYSGERIRFGLSELGQVQVIDPVEGK